MQERLVTEIKLEVHEQARCLCGWCGSEIKTGVQGNHQDRLLTTGEGSKKAAWEGAAHLRESASRFVNANDLKNVLIRKRTATVEGHTVRIIPTSKSRATNCPQV
jgi:hypothetical protein